MNLEKEHIDNLMKLSKQAKVLEQKKELLQKDHNTIDKRISQNKNVIQLNKDVRDSGLKSNLTNKLISDSIKKGVSLSGDQLHLFQEYKKNLTILQKIFLSKTSKLNNFGDHSLVVFKKTNKELQDTFKSKDKELNVELKKLTTLKTKLEPVAPINIELKKIKGILSKNVNKTALEKGIVKDSMLGKIIQMIKDYIEKGSTKALSSAISNLQKLETNVSQKNTRSKKMTV